MYELYIDDSGSPKPNPHDQTPYFAMGGVLIDESNREHIEQRIEEFKTRWNMPLSVPLHGNEIRSKQKSFAWLGNLPQHELARFHNELTDMITGCPVIIHACVISRLGYCNRYLQQYNVETWEMMKTALVILLERTAKFVARQNNAVRVIYEKIGRNEDRLIEGYFRVFRANGHPFNPGTASKYEPLSPEELGQRLIGIEGKTKKTQLLQLADLCLYPVAHGKGQPSNRALVAMQNAQMLVDSHIPEEFHTTEGIKYSCFEETTKNRP